MFYASYLRIRKVARMKLKISAALLLALVPALALASPRTARSQQVHDRTPKARIHQSLPHRSS
jgi:hypothetical protein